MPRPGVMIVRTPRVMVLLRRGYVGMLVRSEPLAAPEVGEPHFLRPRIQKPRPHPYGRARVSTVEMGLMYATGATGARCDDRESIPLLAGRRLLSLSSLS